MVRLTPAWAVQGGYGVDVGSGAARSAGDVALRWMQGERISVAARATGFESISEYRTGSGRVYGAGADVAYSIRPELRIAADAMVYRQRIEDRTNQGPWNQRRATVRLEWTAGDDPGAAARARAAGSRGSP
jgi:hypothetical protein